MQAFRFGEYLDAMNHMPVRALYDADPSASNATKAGVIPFVTENGRRRYALMRPIARKPDAGPPPFQIAKGSRMAYVNDQWLDSKEDASILQHSDARENVLITALREGVEELGLNLGHVRQVFLGKEFPFISASTGVTKQVWIGAPEMTSHNCLQAGDLADTAETRWMTIDEVEALCRADHIPIVKAIDKALEAFISQ